MPEKADPVSAPPGFHRAVFATFGRCEGAHALGQADCQHLAYELGLVRAALSGEAPDRDGEIERIDEAVSNALSAMTEGGEETMAPEPSDEPGSPYVRGIAELLYVAGLRAPSLEGARHPEADR